MDAEAAVAWASGGGRRSARPKGGRIDVSRNGGIFSYTAGKAELDGPVVLHAKGSR